MTKEQERDNSKKELIKVHFKNWFGRLLCKHETTPMGDLTVFNGGDRPENIYWRFICKKCGKITKYKQF